MATLTEQEKAEIVGLLARYHTSSQVVMQMREFGVEVDRFQVRSYDPTNARYEAGERWRALFERERTAYLHGCPDSGSRPGDCSAAGSGQHPGFDRVRHRLRGRTGLWRAAVGADHDV